MNPTPKFTQRLIAAAFAAFMLIAAGTPIASAGGDNDRRGRHHDDYDDHYKKGRKHGHGRGCWHPSRHYDPYWGRGGRKCRKSHHRSCRRHHH